MRVRICGRELNLARASCSPTLHFQADPGLAINPSHLCATIMQWSHSPCQGSSGENVNLSWESRNELEDGLRTRTAAAVIGSQSIIDKRSCLIQFSGSGLWRIPCPSWNFDTLAAAFSAWPLIPRATRPPPPPFREPAARRRDPDRPGIDFDRLRWHRGTTCPHRVRPQWGSPGLVWPSSSCFTGHEPPFQGT